MTLDSLTEFLYYYFLEMTEMTELFNSLLILLYIVENALYLNYTL